MLLCSGDMGFVDCMYTEMYCGFWFSTSSCDSVPTGPSSLYFSSKGR